MNDNHANNDPFAEISPNTTDDAPPQQRHQSLNDSESYDPEIFRKINYFNSLADHLATNLASFNRNKGWKHIHDPNVQAFLPKQQNFNVAQPKEIENEASKKDKGTCHRGLTLRGATLRGGILSGEFKSVGVVETQK